MLRRASRSVTVSVASTGVVVADRVRVADTHWTRMKGLLWTSVLADGEVLWIKPCRQVHMYGMRYPIDVVFLDVSGEVMGVVENLKPNTLSPRVAAAESVLELSCGSIARGAISVGCSLRILGVFLFVLLIGSAATARRPTLLSFTGTCMAAEPEAAAPTPSPTPEAPFGLTWLAPKDQVAALVGPLEKPFPTEFGESYVVSSLPKDLADLYYAVLSFDADGRLVRITAIGGAVDNDSTGARIRARYDELRKLLENKYVSGKANENTDPAFSGERWQLGLQVKKNWSYTIFEPTDLRIELSLFAEAGRSNWRMIFEHLPSMRRLEQQRKKSDQEAL